MTANQIVKFATETTSELARRCANTRWVPERSSRRGRVVLGVLMVILTRQSL